MDLLSKKIYLDLLNADAIEIDDNFYRYFSVISPEDYIEAKLQDAEEDEALDAGEDGLTIAELEDACWIEDKQHYEIKCAVSGQDIIVKLFKLTPLS